MWALQVINPISKYLKGDGYQARSLRGFGLTILDQGGQNMLRLVSNLILTRILFPEAFGMMALVQVVLAGAAMFSDLGIRGAIVQDKRGAEPTFLNTAWTLQIARGMILGLVILSLSGVLADFYEVPLLASLLTIAAIVPVIQGFNSTRMAMADREIMLGRLTALTLGSQFLGLVIAVLLALWLQSVWALVIGNVIGALILATLSHVMLPGIRNRLAFERDAAKRLFGFGRFIFLATLASFFVRHGDRAVLGKFVSLEALAIYNIGFFLATVPLIFAQALNARVIFPLYARRPPRESASNKSKIDKARFLLTGFLMSGTTVLALISIPLIELLYDDRYQAAGPVLTLIALGTLPLLITLSYERLPLASGHSGRYATFTISRAVVQFGLLLLGISYFGLPGAILAPATAWVLLYPLLVFLIRPYRGWDPRHDLIFVILSLVVIYVTYQIHEAPLTALLFGS